MAFFRPLFLWLILSPLLSFSAFAEEAPHAGVLAMVGDLLVNASGTVVAGQTIAPKRFLLLYFSAHWCPSCKKFTPNLVKFYNQKKSGDNFEIIFVSSDRSAVDMAEYMKVFQMGWPAVKYEAIASSGIKKFGGPGIPCLTLLNPRGEVLSHSFVNGSYVGPTKVLNDLDKLLVEQK